MLESVEFALVPCPELGFRVTVHSVPAGRPDSLNVTAYFVTVNFTVMFVGLPVTVTPPLLGVGV
jgi:hypothetical protein